MQFDRRTFLKNAAVGVGAATLATGAASAKPPVLTLDDRLDVDGGEQEVVVVFRRNEDATLLDRYDLPEGYHRFETLPVASAVATGEQLGSLAGLRAVRRITPNYELEYHNDDASETTRAQRLVEDLGYDGGNAHAAVIDSGLDGPHPDHQENVVNHFQPAEPIGVATEPVFVEAGGADTDDSGHGTHVTGTVGGDGSQNEQYRGMAPGVDLTVYSMGATVLILNFLAAYDHLLARQERGETNVQVVNNSFGAVTGSGADFDPVDPEVVASYRAFQAGILPCIAAGNCGPEGSLDCTRSGDNTLGNTAQAPWVLGVAATHDDRSVTGFSSRGRPPSYDGLVNYDRWTALENYEEYTRSLHPPGEDTDTEGVVELSGSGALVGTSIDEIAGNPTQSEVAAQFTLSPSTAEGTALDSVDGYFVSTELSWSPATGEGAPEPSEFEYKLLDGDGSVVASAGTNFVDSVRTEAAVTLQTYLERPEGAAPYELLVEVSRGGGEYEVSGEVLALDAPDGVPSPERPYSIERPSIGAPGDGIWSTMLAGDQADDPTDGDPYYAAISGTSMSTPVVTGIVALLNDAYYEERGEFPPVLDVVDAIESTAAFGLEGVSDGTDEPAGGDYDGYAHATHTVGAGFIDAEAALAALLGGRESAPVVEAFTVTEAGRPDPHADITAEWAVSDDDGDLASATVSVVDADTEEVLETTTTTVSGASASGVDEFTIRHADGGTFDVVLAVEDARGDETTASRTVTESGDGDRPGAGRDRTTWGSHLQE